MGNVNQTIIVPFVNAFGDPPREELLDLFEEQLSRYSDEVLDTAREKVLKEWDRNTWPVIGVVHQACKSVTPAPPPVDTFPEYDFTPHTPEERARVAEMHVEFKANMEEFRRNQEAARKSPKAAFPDRPTFERMQRESPNFHLHMTPEGQRKFLDTGRKPDHPKPDLMNSDYFQETLGRHDPELADE